MSRAFRTSRVCDACARIDTPVNPLYTWLVHARHAYVFYMDNISHYIVAWLQSTVAIVVSLINPRSSLAGLRRFTISFQG